MRLCRSLFSRPMSRGAFIVFEGCDRSGKTTQCKKLVDALVKEGYKAKLCRFPDESTDTGRMCRSYLQKKTPLEDHAIHLLFAANRWEMSVSMKKELLEGTTLIVDRYAFSGVAFSAAKSNMDLSWCQKPESGLLKPDVVLYLSLSAEEAAKRAAFGDEIYENTEFQLNVAKNYELLKDETWKTIDASKSIEDLHLELKELTKNFMEEYKDKEIGRLWMSDSPDAKKLKRSPLKTDTALNCNS